MDSGHITHVTMITGYCSGKSDIFVPQFEFFIGFIPNSQLFNDRSLSFKQWKDKTRNLFDFNRLKMMKKSAKIINVARGGIINEHDLSKALNQGLISGAAIDVFEQEPLNKNNPLLSAKNIVLTPHLGASTIEAKKGVSRAISEQIRDYLLYSKLANAINMPISNMSLLNDIKPFLKLGELLGDIISQLNDDSIIKIVIECQGSAEELRPIS